MITQNMPVAASRPETSAQFAKLFQHPEHGQLLAMLDSSGKGPELRFFCMPEGLGVCSVHLGFEDSDDGWNAAEMAFEAIDMEKCVMMTGALRDSMSMPDDGVILVTL